MSRSVDEPFWRQVLAGKQPAYCESFSGRDWADALHDAYFKALNECATECDGLRAENARLVDEHGRWKRIAGVQDEKAHRWLERLNAHKAENAKLRRVVEAARRFLPAPEVIQWEQREIALREALRALDGEGE